MSNIEKSPVASVARKTKFEIDEHNEKMEEIAEKKKPESSKGGKISQMPDDDDSSDYEKNLEVNWNHVWREEYEKDLEKYNKLIQI